MDGFNFVLADLETGISAYLAVFLANVRHFGPNEIGLAIAAGGFASVVVQIPAGVLKRQPPNALAPRTNAEYAWLTRT